MTKLKLEPFLNGCKKCGTTFKSYEFFEYGPIRSSSRTGENFCIFPENDSTWQSVDEFIKPILSAFHLSQMKEAEVGLAIHEITLDPSLSGEHLYMWGDMACPNCGSLERSSLKPALTGLLEVEVPSATHTRWNAIPSEKQEALIREVITNHRFTRRSPK